ncbi:DUF1330 domain-containing protein [Actinoplanes solisilvae]|uniref:DUF1330 domain-containing protein n=1 Tax=Actinoplanes solisilvae TaxID=2486853 RepID=UPI000FD7C84B|nr:DUF1330 domain-containing protein [Actinoplanes solisilvae]
MATYLINHLRIPGGVPNEGALSYLEQVDATLAAFGGKILAQSDPTVVEGAWPGSVVLIQFADRATAEAWYNSPEYQRILPLRTNNSINDLILVDSVADDFTMAGIAGYVRSLQAGAA